MNSSTDDIVNLFHGGPRPILIIAVGNTIRSDDGAGPYIASRLSPEPDGFVIVNAGEKPESAVDKASRIKPAKIVIIDAADFGGRPGEARIIPVDSIPCDTLSTHRFPLGVIARILEDDTGSKVFFLGIQPQSVSLGETISLPVRKTADKLVEIIRGSESIDG